MIVKLIASALALMLSLFMVASIEWFNKERGIIEDINKKHQKEIRKLRKIKSINRWLDKVIKPLLNDVPNNPLVADTNLVTFFDHYAKSYNFTLTRYIYDDGDSKFINMSFEIDRNDLSTIETFLQLRYKSGFLSFNRFEVDEKKIAGELLLIQPYEGENNAFKR